MLPTAVAVLYAATAAPVAEGQATPEEALIRNLRLERVDGFSLAAPLAVAGPDRGAVDRVAGLLAQRGQKRIVVVPFEDAPLHAQDRGARWLLEIAAARGVLQGRLRQVDNGLWSAPEPGVFAAAEGRRLDPTAACPETTSEPVAMGPAIKPGLYGPTRRLGELPGTPLALAACDDTPGSFLVLTRTHLFRIELTPAWRVTAQLPLDDLPRHQTPSRFAVGTLLCTLEGRAAFASSDVAGGYEVDAHSLAQQRRLPGAPLAHLEGTWLIGALHDGQAAWRGPDGGLVWGHPAGRPALVLGIDGVLRQGDNVLTESGIGAAAVAVGDRLFWVRTGLGRWGDPDQVQLGTGDAVVGDPVSTATSVRAAAIGRTASDEVRLLLALTTGDRTSIQALRVVLP